MSKGFRYSWEDMRIELGRWADLGNELLERQPDRPVTWEPVSQMIETATPWLRLQNEGLRKIIELSNSSLRPLQDPLICDLGTHRWLQADREEAYSDWLAWILEQLSSPMRIFRTLSIDLPGATYSRPLDVPRVTREEAIAESHEGGGGRTDIVLRFDCEVIILLELKLGEAIDRDRLKAYYEWLSNQDARFKLALLLAVDGPARVEGFELRKWSLICRHLRLAARGLATQEAAFTTAAMTLAYVGAVEENVLRLPRDLGTLFSDQGAGSWFNPEDRDRVSDHIQGWLSLVEARNG